MLMQIRDADAGLVETSRITDKFDRGVGKKLCKNKPSNQSEFEDFICGARAVLCTVGLQMPEAAEITGSGRGSKTAEID